VRRHPVRSEKLRCEKIYKRTLSSIYLCGGSDISRPYYPLTFQAVSGDISRVARSSLLNMNLTLPRIQDGNPPASSQVLPRRDTWVPLSVTTQIMMLSCVKQIDIALKLVNRNFAGKWGCSRKLDVDILQSAYAAPSRNC
jgi:hypothetical protein